MYKWVLLVVLAGAAHADPPFYPRGTTTNQALGGINQNFLDQTTKQQNRLTTTITPANCAVGQALTGAFFNNGYTFGGICSGASVSSSRSTITSGSGIFYSTAATGFTPRQLRVRLVGGGGGGGAAITNAGVVGSTTNFGVRLSSAQGGNGGGQGTGASSSGPNGGAGGAPSGVWASSIAFQGGGGGAGSGGSGAVGSSGGVGGSSCLGGAGYGSGALGASGSAGGSGGANTGGGGGGGSTTATSGGAGGGAGQCVDLIIDSPSASYPYSVGAGGAGGAAGTFAGGAGGAGIIIIDAYY